MMSYLIRLPDGLTISVDSVSGTQAYTVSGTGIPDGTVLRQPEEPQTERSSAELPTVDRTQRGLDFFSSCAASVMHSLLAEEALRGTEIDVPEELASLYDEVRNGDIDPRTPLHDFVALFALFDKTEGEVHFTCATERFKPVS